MATVEQVQAEAERDSRVCPQPQQWQKLYEMLPHKQRSGNGWQPPLPLILGAWWHSSDTDKQLRLREHIEWAVQHGYLDEVHSFLCALPESQWHHRGH